MCEMAQNLAFLQIILIATYEIHENLHRKRYAEYPCHVGHAHRRPHYHWITARILHIRRPFLPHCY
jgi:hypothetical protein